MIAQLLLPLVPWALVAVATGVILWSVAAVFRRRDLSNPPTTEQFRESLERIWAVNL